MKRWAAALALVAMRFVLLAMGGREATGLIAGNTADLETAALGAAFVVVHLATVLAVPILLLWVGLERVLRSFECARERDSIQTNAHRVG